MSIGYWNQVQRTGFALPTDRPLNDLTADLTSMLGSTDPSVRDGTARPALVTWIAHGVYDDLLSGLGDGMVAGLRVGLGESGTDTVFRRSSSASVLKECLRRDADERLVPDGKVMERGDHLVTWWLHERDTRGEVPDQGRARAVGHGAEAIAALAESPRLGAGELMVLLDVLVERVVMSTDPPLTLGDHDRIAAAAMAILRRDLVPLEAVETWVGDLAGAAAGHAEALDGPQHLVRALFVQLSLATDQPAARPDVLLALVDVLRITNAAVLQGLPCPHD